MPKKICNRCKNEFDKFPIIDGKKRYLHQRRYCLTCVPLGKHHSKKVKSCKKCHKIFEENLTINGKNQCLRSRKFCLDCSPFGTNNRRDISKPQIDYFTPRICKRCNKEYLYDRKKGHRKSFCNSCKKICYDIQRKVKAVQYKGGHCVFCGYNNCMRSLAFHHINPSQKSFQIGAAYNFSWDRMKNELDKCILVCNNCHGEIHDGLLTLERFHQ